MGGCGFMCWGRSRVKVQPGFPDLGIDFLGCPKVGPSLDAAVRRPFLVLLSPLGMAPRGKPSPVTKHGGSRGPLPDGTSLGTAVHPALSRTPAGDPASLLQVICYKMRPGGQVLGKALRCHIQEWPGPGRWCDLNRSRAECKYYMHAIYR